jgi:septal ring factor EnvC (AmiA/AmiB activator)
MSKATNSAERRARAAPPRATEPVAPPLEQSRKALEGLTAQIEQAQHEVATLKRQLEQERVENKALKDRLDSSLKALEQLSNAWRTLSRTLS